MVLFLMAVAMGVVAAATFFWPYMADPAIGTIFGLQWPQSPRAVLRI
jgi:hypothetical protein